MKKIISLCTLSLGLAACGGASDTSLETAFCDGLERPAARSVVATRQPADAPDATDEARVDVRLEADAGAATFSGLVTYRPDEVGSFAFGLTEDVGLVVRDATGAVVPLTASVTGSTECTALAVRYTVSLELATYTLEIGPAAQDTVGLIAEESDDDL